MSKLTILLLHAKCFTHSTCLSTHNSLVTKYVCLPVVYFSNLTSIFHLIGVGGLHDHSSKRMPSVPPGSASRAQEEPKQQLSMILNNISHRWNPSSTDTRCQVNVDAECRFQQLAGSVHNLGMLLDMVQSDVIQLNRAMKEASTDCGRVQQKVDLLEDTLQQIAAGKETLIC